MMRVADSRVVIAGRTDAGRILCSPRRREGIAYLISIGGDAEPPPAGFRNVPTRLRLVFEDEISLQRGGPSQQDIEHLIKFARGVDLVGARALLQCQAGVSRSTAAAVILLRTVDPDASAAEIAQYVKQACPSANPNREMLRLAAAILGTDLVEAWSRDLP